MSALDLYAAQDSPRDRDLFAPVMSLKQLWVILWAYRYVLVAVPFLFGVIAIGLVKYVIPKNYQARTTLFVAFASNDSISAGELADSNSWGFISTQIELMREPSTLGTVVESLRLHENKDFLAGYSGDGSPESVKRHAATVLNTRLSIYPGQGTRFIYLYAQDRNPVMAATIANAVADSYVDTQLRQIVEPVKQRIARYSEQIETLRANVEAAQTKVAEFRQRTGLVSLGGVDSEGARLADMERRLSEASARRQDAELRLRRVRQGDAAVVSSPLVQSLKAQLQAKEAETSELAESLGPRHPSMVALRAESLQLREQLDREMQVQVSSGRAEVEALAAVEADLRRQLEAQRGKVMSTRKLQDEGSSLLQGLDSATKVYQAAMDSFERAQFGTQMAANNVNIINRATPPTKHMPGGRKKIILAVGLGGMLAGGGCLLYELLNRRVRCREDLESDLGLPVLIELRRA
ncbi:Wzz/FepE/Etk N-terminal domain-containing protein [Panacagrimonas sp.]|uniref:Wzz/FepE/Etk N-terminal domain-containing protein n=1 Tax=Panacagrimonas sp. TaxID=2480088 RepID=UPI003B52631B